MDAARGQRHGAVRCQLKGNEATIDISTRRRRRRRRPPRDARLATRARTRPIDSIRPERRANPSAASVVGNNPLHPLRRAGAVIKTQCKAPMAQWPQSLGASSRQVNAHPEPRRATIFHASNNNCYTFTLACVASRRRFKQRRMCRRRPRLFFSKPFHSLSLSFSLSVLLSLAVSRSLRRFIIAPDVQSGCGATSRQR